MTSEGASRKYRIYVPPNYNRNNEVPVVFSYHGWGSSASFNENYMGLTNVARDNTFIAVYPEGMSDYQRQSNSGWQSFNAGGSTTTLGEECTPQTDGYCYMSCNQRPQGCGRCDWTSCYNDVQFTEEILDALEANYCVDTARVYATGYSNGGIMAYEAGRRLANRFAAIVPGGGTPFVGHNEAPPVSRDGAVSVMDLHGTRDRTCPANDTTSSDGWNYEPVDNVIKVWATAHGCTGTAKIVHFATPEDGQTQLWCASIGSCPEGVDMVRCSYNAGHDWLGPRQNGGPGARVAWHFMQNHPKVTAKQLALNATATDAAVAEVKAML